MRKILILALSVLFVLCFLSCDGSVYSSFFDSSSEKTTYEVGDRGPAGGIVFYDCDADNTEDDPDGADNLLSSVCEWRYLEAAPNDLVLIGSTPSVDSSADGYSSATLIAAFIFGFYRPDGTATAVDTGTAIGTGASNTELLVTAMGVEAWSSSDGSGKNANYAAKLCADLEYGGYDDWFLPSKDELAKMYAQKNTIGGFDDLYWSSSEYDDSAISAWRQIFSSGDQSDLDRSNGDRVRPLRAFF